MLKMKELIVKACNGDTARYEKAVNTSYEVLREGGGLLPEETLGYFLRKATINRVLLGNCNFELMKAPQKRLPSIDISGRIMQDAYTNANTHEVNPNINSAVLDIKSNILEARGTRAKIELPDDDVEDNVEKERYVQTVLDVAANKWGADLEFLNVFGDTAATTGNNLLKVHDGWHKMAGKEVNPADLPENFDVETIFNKMLATIPPEFRVNISDLRFYVPYAVQDAYRDALIERGTGLGDTAQTEYNELKFKGIPVIECNTLDAPDTSLPNNKKPLLLTQNSNLYYGVYKDFIIEPERDVPNMRTNYWFNSRTDAACEFNDGIVKCDLTPDQIEQL